MSRPPQRRRRNDEDEPLLFDLPLTPPERREASGRSPAVEPHQPSLFTAAEPAEHEEESDQESLPRFAAEPAPEPPATPVVAGLGSRLLAGCADALLHLGVLGGVYLGLVALGIEPRVSHWPAFATLLVVFSFLSSVVSLAFWGQTAGMAWRGLQSRDRLQRPLTFRQAMLRWAGGLATFGAAGLPLLFALGGASLTDWLSHSVTYQTVTGDP